MPSTAGENLTRTEAKRRYVASVPRSEERLHAPGRPSPDSDAVVDTHEWVSFDHDDETYLFDVTFLTSNWRCIWDDGCLGIRPEPTPDDQQGCCSFGAHFSDDDDKALVEAAKQRLRPDDWQHHAHADNWCTRDDDGDWQTTVVDDGCVFLNRPGFPGGAGCALHRGALAAGESIVEWKPEVCWQLPLRLEYHTDENDRGVHTVRQWRRHDWGDGGTEFHWWCTEDDRAFVGHVPAYQELRDELIGLVGPDVAAMLRSYLDQRGTERLLPHPVYRGRS